MRHTLVVSWLDEAHSGCLSLSNIPCLVLYVLFFGAEKKIVSKFLSPGQNIIYHDKVYTLMKLQIERHIIFNNFRIKQMYVLLNRCII